MVEQKGNFGHDDLESNLLDHEMHFVPGNSEIWKKTSKYIMKKLIRHDLYARISKFVVLYIIYTQTLARSSDNGHYERVV